MTFIRLDLLNGNFNKGQIVSIKGGFLIRLFLFLQRFKIKKNAIMKTAQVKKTFVLGVLFVLPLVAYLFFASGVN
ncbi:hypothetical protein Flav3CDRAFT_0166, partial [Flavobacteria bacterium MS024-3C]